MIESPRVPRAEADVMDQTLERNAAELQTLLGSVSRQLSQFSHQVGLVLAPEVQRIIVERLEFVRLDARRVIAILIGTGGVVHNRTLEVEENLEQVELDQVSNYLSNKFRGHLGQTVRRERSPRW